MHDHQSVILIVEAIRSLAGGGLLPKDLAKTPLNAATEVAALGLDSFGKVTLLTELEERADVTLSESYLVGIRTLGDLAEAIAKAIR